MIPDRDRSGNIRQMADRAQDKGEELYDRARRYASDTVDQLSGSSESAKRTAKNVASDVSNEASRLFNQTSREGSRQGDSIEKAKELAKDYLLNKADDAKDALKTIGKVADTAGTFIDEKKR